MAKAGLGDILGKWAFLIGVLLAIGIGLFPSIGGVVTTTALVVIGLIVGLLNIGSKETTPFLFSGLVLVVISSMGMAIMQNVPFINGILTALLAIFVPATVVVAIKHVFTLAKK